MGVICKGFEIRLIGQNRSSTLKKRLIVMRHATRKGDSGSTNSRLEPVGQMDGRRLCEYEVNSAALG